MSKPILIIGPAGSGKTRKMEEITAGKKKRIQYSFYKLEETEQSPDYYVFEEIDPNKLDIIATRLKFLLIYKSTLDHVVAEACPVFILISQCPLWRVPEFYKTDEFEIIDLNK